MLYKEITAVCPQIHTKQININCVDKTQNLRILDLVVQTVNN